MKRAVKQVALDVFSARIHSFVWRERKITKGINRNILFRFKTRDVALRKTRQFANRSTAHFESLLFIFCKRKIEVETEINLRQIQPPIHSSDLHTFENVITDIFVSFR